ncbi:MAG: hypothetical protein KGL39_55140 [Patescibacteria group bacterium]|nr:hypothetical protein [Patescibacteria group bacterium]
MEFTVTLRFGKGYIAHPYWPERLKAIDIQKESGMNRARSMEKRAATLQHYLQSLHPPMEFADYELLCKLADRQFYRFEDVPEELDGHNPKEIVIPAHHLYGCMANAADLATSSIRLCSPEQVRTVLQVSSFATGKTECDDVWRRNVVVTSGTGGRLSNQRALRENEFISHFEAKGTVSFSEHIVKPEKVYSFMEFAGRDVGVGASRKIGWGRFEISAWAAAK